MSGVSEAMHLLTAAQRELLIAQRELGIIDDCHRGVSPPAAPPMNPEEIHRYQHNALRLLEGCASSFFKAVGDWNAVESLREVMATSPSHARSPGSAAAGAMTATNASGMSEVSRALVLHEKSPHAIVDRSGSLVGESIEEAQLRGLLWWMSAAMRRSKQRRDQEMMALENLAGTIEARTAAITARDSRRVAFIAHRLSLRAELLVRQRALRKWWRWVVAGREVRQRHQHAHAQSALMHDQTNWVAAHRAYWVWRGLLTERRATRRIAGAEATAERQRRHNEDAQGSAIGAMRTLDETREAMARQGHVLRETALQRDELAAEAASLRRSLSEANTLLAEQSALHDQVMAEAQSQHRDALQKALATQREEFQEAMAAAEAARGETEGIAVRRALESEGLVVGEMLERFEIQLQAARVHALRTSSAKADAFADATRATLREAREANWDAADAHRREIAELENAVKAAKEETALRSRHAVSLEEEVERLQDAVATVKDRPPRPQESRGTQAPDGAHRRQQETARLGVASVFSTRIDNLVAGRLFNQWRRWSHGLVTGRQIKTLDEECRKLRLLEMQLKDEKLAQMEADVAESQTRVQILHDENRALRRESMAASVLRPGGSISPALLSPEALSLNVPTESPKGGAPWAASSRRQSAFSPVAAPLDIVAGGQGQTVVPPGRHRPSTYVEDDISSIHSGDHGVANTSMDNSSLVSGMGFGGAAPTVPPTTSPRRQRATVVVMEPLERFSTSPSAFSASPPSSQQRRRQSASSAISEDAASPSGLHDPPSLRLDPLASPDAPIAAVNMSNSLAGSPTAADFTRASSEPPQLAVPTTQGRNEGVTREVSAMSLMEDSTDQAELDAMMETLSSERKKHEEAIQRERNARSMAEGRLRLLESELETTKSALTALEGRLASENAEHNAATDAALIEANETLEAAETRHTAAITAAEERMEDLKSQNAQLLTRVSDADSLASIAEAEKSKAEANAKKEAGKSADMQKRCALAMDRCTHRLLQQRYFSLLRVCAVTRSRDAAVNEVQDRLIATVSKNDRRNSAALETVHAEKAAALAEARHFRQEITVANEAASAAKAEVDSLRAANEEHVASLMASHDVALFDLRETIATKTVEVEAAEERSVASAQSASEAARREAAAVAGQKALTQKLNSLGPLMVEAVAGRSYTAWRAYAAKKKLTREVATAVTLAEGYKAEIAALDEALQRTESKVDEAKEEAEEANKKLAAANREKDGRRRSVDATAAALTSAKAEIAEQKTRAEDAEAELAKRIATCKCSQLAGENKVLRGQAQDGAALVAELQANITNMTAEVTAATAERDAAKEEADVARAELADLQAVPPPEPIVVEKIDEEAVRAADEATAEAVARGEQAESARAEAEEEREVAVQGLDRLTTVHRKLAERMVEEIGRSTYLRWRLFASRRQGHQRLARANHRNEELQNELNDYERRYLGLLREQREAPRTPAWNAAPGSSPPSARRHSSPMVFERPQDQGPFGAPSSLEDSPQSPPRRGVRGEAGVAAGVLSYSKSINETDARLGGNALRALELSEKLRAFEEDAKVFAAIPPQPPADSDDAIEGAGPSSPPLGTPPTAPRGRSRTSAGSTSMSPAPEAPESGSFRAKTPHDSLKNISPASSGGGN